MPARPTGFGQACFGGCTLAACRAAGAPAGDVGADGFSLATAERVKARPGCLLRQRSLELSCWPSPLWSLEKGKLARFGFAPRQAALNFRAAARTWAHDEPVRIYFQVHYHRGHRYAVSKTNAQGSGSRAASSSSLTRGSDRPTR